MKKGIIRKGIIPKLSLAVALAAAVALYWPANAAAAFDPGLTHWESANTLIMPYDVTANHESFQIVSKVGVADCDTPDDCRNPIATHWAYWSKDCDHLGDVFICLTQDDTVIVDPKHLQASTQRPDKSENLLLGDQINIDLVGGESAKGFVTVTAYTANIGQSGLACNPLDPTAFEDGQLIGGWTIADSSTGAAYGNDAIGLTSENGLPEVPKNIDSTNVRIQTFNPTGLKSQVSLIGIQEARGQGNFSDEIGPIVKGLPTISCQTFVVDNLENHRSLRDVEFTCAGFSSIGDILGPGVPLNSSGFLLLTGCTSTPDELIGCTGPGGRCSFSPAGDRQDQFLFAFHGQALGTFGVAISGKYTNADIGPIQ